MRPATDMEASNEHKFGHGQRDGEAQGVSDEEAAEQRDDEEEEGRPARHERILEHRYPWR